MKMNSLNFGRVDIFEKSYFLYKLFKKSFLPKSESLLRSESI